MFHRILVVISLVFALGACSGLMYSGGHRDAVSTRLVDFLYPKESDRQVHKPEIPVLNLPVRVGLAFVPSKQWRQNGFHESQQIELLNQVKAEFEKQDYIDQIEVIPSTYLKGDNGFDSMDRISRMYNVDVMALVSYDQMRRSSENTASLLYWTIVGAYIIPGNDNRVQTFVDTAVFDIKSRNMLFRAPGHSKLKQSSTAVKIDDSINAKSAEGFQLAMTEMQTNLATELERFKVRVKEEKVAEIRHKPGYSGAGSIGLTLLILFGCMVGRNLFRRP